ncbi:unnamed protein product, partial [Ectocarpus sp. 8 AP-2014]
VTVPKNAHRKVDVGVRTLAGESSVCRTFVVHLTFLCPPRKVAVSWRTNTPKPYMCAHNRQGHHTIITAARMVQNAERSLCVCLTMVGDAGICKGDEQDTMRENCTAAAMWMYLSSNACLHKDLLCLIPERTEEITNPRIGDPYARAFKGKCLAHAPERCQKVTTQQIG